MLVRQDVGIPIVRRQVPVLGFEALDKLEQSLICHLVAGEILMWPAFLLHFVHPTLSDDPRVSVSFNLVLKWSDTYLPQQD